MFSLCHLGPLTSIFRRISRSTMSKPYRSNVLLSRSMDALNYSLDWFAFCMFSIVNCSNLWLISFSSSGILFAYFSSSGILIESLIYVGSITTDPVIWLGAISFSFLILGSTSCIKVAFTLSLRL